MKILISESTSLCSINPSKVAFNEPPQSNIKQKQRDLTRHLVVCYYKPPILCPHATAKAQRKIKKKNKNQETQNVHINRIKVLHAIRHNMGHF